MIPWTVTVLLCVILFLFKLEKKTTAKQDGLYPPQVRSIPFIGGFLWFFTKNMSKTFMDIGKEYGPIARTYMGWNELIVLNSPNSVKEAGKVAALGGQADLLITRVMNGKGIIWADDAKEQRKFVLKNFKHLEISKELESTILDEVTRFFDRLKAHENDVFDFKHAFGIHTVNAMFQILFGVRLPPNDPEVQHILDQLEILAELRNPIMRLCFYFPSLADWFPSSLSGKAFLEKFASDFYKSVKRNMEINQKSRTEKLPRNFSDAIMDKVAETSDESSVFHASHDESIPIIIDMIAAALDTTSSTLEWAMCFLSQYPQVQKKLQAEIDEIAGDGYPSISDRDRMPYFQAVLQELFRMAPVLPFGVHKATVDTQLMDYKIKKDSFIFSNFYGIQMDPDLWENPELFNPGRFIDQNGNFIKSDLIFTFGHGRRSCVGESLARDQLFVFLTRIFQSYNVVRVKKLESISGRILVAYHCLECKAKFVPRKG